MECVKQKILYGAGQMGKRAFDFYMKDSLEDIYCFADTYKFETEYLGKPVISFNELTEIHEKYEIIVCVFDLFDVVFSLVNAGINNYTIWSDHYTLGGYECSQLLSNYMKKFDSNNKLKKILYGAGCYGEIAYRLYGNDMVYAFADSNKYGEVYCDKEVLSPLLLQNLCDAYEIIICVEDYISIEKYLKEIGVYNFRVFFQINDLRTTDMTDSDYLCFTFGSNNTMQHPNIINEIKHLDFIESPEMLKEYKNYYIHASRMFASPSKSTKAKCVISRSLSENLLYGYFDAILKFAGKDNHYFEAPAIHHGYAWTNAPYKLYCHNLMEPGNLFKKEAHGISRDCLFHTMGPYMNYVDSFYDITDCQKIKNHQGKTLTVFPYHTGMADHSYFDSQLFFNNVMNEAKKFDSIILCVYFNDYESDFVRMFKSAGAKVSCAGYVFDPSFVRRLKTILILTDAVITNGWGSHIQHSLSMGKPVKFIAQDINGNFLHIPDDEYHSGKSSGGIYAQMLDAIMQNDYVITKEQLDIYEPTTGFSKVKTKSEMGAILDLSKIIMQNCNYNAHKYVDSVRNIYRSLKDSTKADDKLLFDTMQNALPLDYEEFI